MIAAQVARDEKVPSCEVRRLASFSRSTFTADCWVLLMRAEKGTSSAWAIFHSTLMVGADCPSSTWPSMARLTPEAWARRSSDSPRSVRRRRRFLPTTGARSALVLAGAASAVRGVFLLAIGAPWVARPFKRRDLAFEADGQAR